jgi:preprotein translocase subunit SecE
MAKDKELAVSEKKSEKVSKKKEQSKKQGGLSKWFKDLKLELKKVVWPDKKTVVNNSIVVFAAMLGFAAFTFLLDKGFLWLFQLAIGGKS